MIKNNLIRLILLTLPLFFFATSCGKTEQSVVVPEPKPDPKDDPKPTNPVDEKWVGIDVVKALQEKTTLIKSITSQSRVTLEEGIEHTKLQFVTNTDRNMTIHVVIANLASSKLTAQVLNPFNTDEKRFQALDVMAQANEEVGTKLVVAINGDYFSWTNMETTGPFIYDGKVRKANSAGSVRPAFGITRTGQPVFLNAPSGSTNVFQFGDNLLRHLIGGNPWYIYNGVKMTFTDTTVEPRTSIGMLDKNQVVFIVVDGRDATHSSGMSFLQMQTLYDALGAKYAFNLDGGGSTTIVVREKKDAKWNVVNKPSDNPLRVVANGVAFVLK